MEAQLEYLHIAYTFSHVWHRFCMLSRCLLTFFSASELSRKFIRSALLVGPEQKGELDQRKGEMCMCVCVCVRLRGKRALPLFSHPRKKSLFFFALIPTPPLPLGPISSSMGEVPHKHRYRRRRVCDGGGCPPLLLFLLLARIIHASWGKVGMDTG